MTEMAFACRYAVEDAGGLEATDIDALNRHLRRRLHNLGGYYHEPLDLVAQRLQAP